MQLDIRTLVIVAIFVSLVPSLVGALVWRTRRTYPGFGRWTLGNLLATFCLIFLSLRGSAPDWISIVLANALAIGAGIMFLQGIRLFRGLRPYRWPEYLAGVLALAAVIYFRYATDNISVRIVVMSLALGSLGLGCGITLLKGMPGGRRFSMVFTGIVFVLAGSANLLRGVYFYLYSPATDLFAPSAANGVFFACAGLAIITWSFGFILMTGERLVRDSKQAQTTTVAALESGVGAPISGQAVPEAEVRRELQRIIESAVFRRSARMERFLTVAVERTLTGHPEELKEYALGRDVFNRGDDYDPRADSIVRVEAQRLRRKLHEYYQSYGKDDPVIVEFHPGSYVPTFRSLNRNQRRVF